MDFTGKNIVVTGASSGIGRAAANLLAQRGANVFALSRSAQTGKSARRAQALFCR